jgi:hypothetical protein
MKKVYGIGPCPDFRKLLIENCKSRVEKQLNRLLERDPD